MVDINTTPDIGCVLEITVRGDYEGELSIEELEEVDEVMSVMDGGRDFTTRIGVSTTEFDEWVSIKYIVQKSLHAKALINKEDRLEAFTVLEDPFIVVDSTPVEYE